VAEALDSAQVIDLDFIIFSNVGWEHMDGALPPTQFARELLTRGHRVLFVEMDDSPNRPQTDNLRVVGLRVLGLSEMEGLRAWYGQAYGPLDAWRAGVTRALDEFECAAPNARVAIWTLPFAPLVELAPMLKARGYYLVYDCLDDFEGLTSAGYHLYFPEVEEYLVTQSDLLVVLSNTLVEKFRPKRDHIALIRDGITLSDFANVPPRTPNPAALRLGFWGTVTHFMVDADLLEYVAQSRPDWQIDMIGPYDADSLAPPIAPGLSMHPNIHLLGRRPHASLAQHLALLDVCLLPSPVDRFNLGRDPVKIYEYLAGYRPVVATNLTQLARMPYVYLARDRAEFVAKVEEAAATPVDHAAVDRFLAEQTWACRVDALLENISRVTPRTTISPFVPPPPHTAPDALRAYIAALERLIAQRTAHVHQLEEILAETGVGPGLRRIVKRFTAKLRRGLMFCK
jgi:glycosyltransferase involved in cell wall biosynthesis